MEDHMAEAAKKLPVAENPATENKETPLPTRREWPLDRLRDEIDHLIDSFRRDTWPNPFRRSTFDMEPFWRPVAGWNSAPAVDIAEKDGAYEITAELPGIDEKNLEVQLSNDVLVIKGEKQEEKEEKQKDYHLSERRFGSFQRSFRLPEDVEAEKIEAQFKNGVLTVTLPKSAEAKKKEKKIAVKAA
jgi:HSP20 family protein